MTIFVSACHQTWLSLDDEGETLIVLVERHWVFDKGSRWPYLSLRAIGLACLWMVKVVDDYHNLPFDRRATRGSWVRLPRKENAQTRHNVYSRKTLEKPKAGLWTLIIKGSWVVFTHGEGISTPRIRHKGRQPLIKCVKSWLQFYFIIPFLFFYLFGVDKSGLLLLHILNCDEELRPM